MKFITLLLPLALLACGQSPQTDTVEETDSLTAPAADTTEALDHSGTYEYVSPYNSLDRIENHYIVLIKNTDDSYSGRYYGTTDLFDTDRAEYLQGFFVLPMHGLQIHEEQLSFDLIPAQTDFFNETIDLSMTNSAEAMAAGLTAWEVYAGWEAKHFTGTLRGGTLTLDDQAEEMTFIPMN